MPRSSKTLQSISNAAHASHPNTGRHSAKCRICRHSQREDIEEDFIAWRSPRRIAQDYGLSRYCVYRHARATNLYPQRRRNVRAALERIIEQAETVEASASSIV